MNYYMYINNMLDQMIDDVNYIKQARIVGTIKK